MKPSKPPALATWMLEHLLWGGRNEALAGDLQEEFQRRHSRTWYWRQVFGAISASFSNELRADWVVVWTVLFTTVWAYSLYAIPIIASPVPMSVSFRLSQYLAAHGYYGTPVWHLFMYVFRYALPFLFHVAIPLGIYLYGVRNMNVRGFTRGLCAGVLLTVLLGFVPFQPILDFLSMHGFSYYWVQLWKLYEVMVMRQFIPLMAAMWVAQSVRKAAQPVVIAS